MFIDVWVISKVKTLIFEILPHSIFEYDQFLGSTYGDDLVVWTLQFELPWKFKDDYFAFALHHPET